MPGPVRSTLLDFFADVSALASDFLVYHDGYRAHRYSYRDVSEAARTFGRRLHAGGVRADDKIIFWGENRPGWIMALWGSLMRGVVIVPIDYRASEDFLWRVTETVKARVVIIGEDVKLRRPATDVAIWRFVELEEPSAMRPVSGGAPGEAIPPVAVTADTVAEIIFTSGATAEPKGVVITHRNILANIVPIEREIAKYRRYAWPFFPLRFLNLLPLSHMFGQAMATFIPPMLAGEVIFIRGYNPHEIIRHTRTKRVSVLISVPKILDVLRDYVRRSFPDVEQRDPDRSHWVVRWWRYRAVHRAFGWKFWSFICGAAPLDPALEAFWSRLGFVVVQGYGLTETAPIVTLNHPFSARKGSVGKPIAGVEVRLAEDGEILVRGENVTKGYYGDPSEAADAFAGGWLHTGDIGELDESGGLVIRGRKKEMIVTPEGLNVFPEDIERVLLTMAGVRDAAVIGRTWGQEERVHAVLLLDADMAERDVIALANRQLEEHQKIGSASRWPGEELPRTEGTQKLKRAELKRWVEGNGGTPLALPTRDDSLETILTRFARGAHIGPETSLDALGLSSLERVELLMALEDRYETTIDELEFAGVHTVADLARLVQSPSSQPVTRAETPRSTTTVAGNRGRAQTTTDAGTLPRWNQRGLARLVRRLSLPSWILPLTRLFARITVEGTELLADLEGPVLFAANHQSHFDTPVILAALPPRWRYHVAVAMAKEFFTAHFYPERHSRKAYVTNSVNYYLATLFFGAFPLPQRESGARDTLRYIGELANGGVSVLIFPEGKRTSNGEINPFRQGVGMIGGKLGVPVVPVRLVGLERVLHHSWRMAHPGPVTVKFGKPLYLTGEDYETSAALVESAVKHLS